MNLPTVVEPWLWPAFTAGVLLFLFLDLFVVNRRPHEITFARALSFSALCVGIALGFNFWFGHRYGTHYGFQFLTGYIIELTLSFDNLFVILMVFQTFHIPPQNQHRVLFWGILGAVVFRGILILLGVELIHKLDWLMYVFGGFLILTGLKFLIEREEEQDLQSKHFVRFIKKLLPVTQELHGQKFFVRKSGKRLATPLFLTLCVVEVADLIFAVDSIPAVLAISTDSFIAFSSNIMAILGLRAFYFLLAGAVKQFRYLKQGLAIILLFIGIKMSITKWYHVDIVTSLTFILDVLFTSGFLSWYVNRRERRSK